MKIANPYTIPTEKFLTPEEMRKVKEVFTEKVKDMLYQTDACIKCYLFDKCMKLSHYNKE